jgi:release factor glutamine methyltransferase
MSERSRSNGGGQETTAAVWAAVSGLTVGDAWLRRDEPKSPELVTRYRNAVAQLERGVPFAYAVGSAGFRTLDLKIDRRALIPRPETEGLVELVLARCSSGVAADIGTGCGCIALSLAVEGRFERIVAVEQSAAAAALARENLQRVAPTTPIEIREGDLLAPLVDTGDRFHVIVSNPPYLSFAEYAELDPSVSRHEPRDALVSGADGLDATRALFAGAAALLEPGGLLALEIDERRAAAVRALGTSHGWNVAIHADLFGRPRYALSIKEG